MGQCTLELFAGGGVSLTPSTSQTIRWWYNRRVQTIRAQVASLNMTLEDPALHKSFPLGYEAIVIVNPKNATHAFNLRQTQVTAWTISVATGQLVVVSRVRSGGAPQWWPTIHTIL